MFFISFPWQTKKVEHEREQKKKEKSEAGWFGGWFGGKKKDADKETAAPGVLG